MKNPSELPVPLQAGAATTALVYPAADDAAALGAALILGHGAGAGQRSTFMVDFARALSALGIDVITFNFPLHRTGPADSGSRAGRSRRVIAR